MAALPPQAALQQTPSTQNVLAQVAPVVHGVPFGSTPVARTKTRALPAFTLVPPTVSPKRSPQRARLPSAVSATDQAKFSLGAAADRSIACSVQAVPTRSKTSALPAASPRALSS